MRTAIDTNVISAIFSKEERWQAAINTLERARAEGGLTLSGVAFAELRAYPGVTAEFLDAYLKNLRIEIDFNFDESLWREAGRRFSRYSERRRLSKAEGEPKRLLADFLVGSHALLKAQRLITLDRRRYERDFAELVLLRVE